MDAHESIPDKTLPAEQSSAVSIPKAIRDALAELDDALGQLSDAHDVLEELTQGTIANKATSPAHQQYMRMRAIVNDVWGTVYPEAAP